MFPLRPSPRFAQNYSLRTDVRRGVGTFLAYMDSRDTSHLPSNKIDRNDTAPNNINDSVQ